MENTQLGMLAQWAGIGDELSVLLIELPSFFCAHDNLLILEKLMSGRIYPVVGYSRVLQLVRI
jgi:hypothetical protein